MVRDGEFLVGLVGAFYESAACPERWKDFLRLVARHMDCDNAVLTLHDAGLSSWGLHQSSGLPPEAVADYNAYYGSINPNIAPLFALVRNTGSWCGLSRELTAEREYRRSEYYNDYGRKYGSYWGVMGAIVSSPRSLITLSVIRSEKKPAPGSQAVALMRQLMPHFAPVVKIHRTMQSLRSMVDAAVQGIDASESTMFAVDGEGGIVLMNCAAESLLREGDGLLISRGHLAANNPEESRRLCALIEAATATGAGRAMHIGGTLLIHRKDQRPLLVSVIPFCSSQRLLETLPCALIFITDPHRQSASRSAVLSSLYQLSPAECRLADFLLRGLDLAEAAACARITKGTARFMLKSIFRKTDTHRQSELMRFMLALPTDSGATPGNAPTAGRRSVGHSRGRATLSDPR